MMKSDKFYRRGFSEVRQDVEDKMGEQFKSDVVNELRSNDFVIERDGVKVYLAKVCIPRTVITAAWRMRTIFDF